MAPSTPATSKNRQTFPGPPFNSDKPILFVMSNLTSVKKQTHFDAAFFLCSYATLEPQQTNISTHISTTRSETPTQIPWFVSKKQYKNPSNHPSLRQPPSMLQIVTTSSTHLYLSACFCLLFRVINWKVSMILWKANMQKSMISS